MTTATELTWPRAHELDAAEQRVRVAANALDELQLRYYRLDEEMTGEGDEGVSLETLGKLACFIEYVDMDIKAMQDHMETIRSAFHAGAIERSGDVR